MIRRIFLVALYTGICQVLSLFTNSYMIRNLEEETCGYNPIIEATILVMTTFFPFGIQLSMDGNMATQKTDAVTSPTYSQPGSQFGSSCFCLALLAILSIGISQNGYICH